MINAVVDLVVLTLQLIKKTVNLCLDSHNCGNFTLSSDCKDGNVTMTCKKSVKDCYCNPQY